MMNPGQYYVGDLCYCLEDRWKEVCDIIIQGRNILEGEFTLADGTKFTMFNTKHGDGLYSDQFGRDYAVDSGSIGCVLFSDIKSNISVQPNEHYQIVTFDQPFECYRDDGDINIGNITIFTDPDYDD